MKKVLYPILTVIAFWLAVQNADAQDFREKISKEFTITGNEKEAILIIYNISGFIKVEGYNGNKVLLEIEKTISADDGKSLETGKKEFRLGFEQKQDTIMAYIAEPYDTRPHRDHFSSDDHRDIDYRFNADFTVRVPSGINLRISTVNGGSISINNVFGSLHVNNVNEGISISNARGGTYAHTVNGNVSVSYLSNPSSESSYNTINGDINVVYQPELSADVRFKSMNGELYTDFTGFEQLPVTIRNEQDKSDRGKVYKLTRGTSFRFGKGGSILKFETLNGNVYIRKQS